jgi:hypothetical protein
MKINLLMVFSPPNKSALPAHESTSKLTFFNSLIFKSNSSAEIPGHNWQTQRGDGRNHNFPWADLK